MSQVEDKDLPRTLSLLLNCPECGGPVKADDDVVSLPCEHCGSRLILSAPDRDEIYWTDGEIQNAEDLRRILILYRVLAHRADIIERYRDSKGNGPPEFFVEERLRAYEASLSALVRVVEAHRVYVPYWHMTGMIVQGILGRHGDGPKVTRIRAFAVDHTVPGYETEKANLRDRGLRLIAASVRPLKTKDAVERAPFLQWISVPQQSYREIDRWKTQDLDRSMEAVTKLGLLLFLRRALVYRPYWLARVFTDKGQENVLFDSFFGTIAGYPDEIETRAMFALGTTDPLHSGEESYRNVHIIPSRCPECGFEQPLDAYHVIVICPSCHQALRLGKDIAIHHYAHGSNGFGAGGTSYIPFWRHEFRIVTGGPRPSEAETLEEYARILFPQGLPPGFNPRGRNLWVPAVRLLGTEAGDGVYQALVEWVHRTPPTVEEEKVPVGDSPEFWGVSVSEQDASQMGPLVLMGLHNSASAARLNTFLVKSAIEGAKLTLSAPTLVLLPFEKTADGVGNAAVHVAALILRGGPELWAQRAFAH